MPKQEWTTVDKEGWGPGPWQDEPDKVQWVDEETGLDCLLHRGPGGQWCGYVGVPPEHPWHGVDYSDCPEKDCDGEGWCDHRPDSRMDVHGGLTFADACRESEDPSTGICHIPEPGRPEHVWWFGFDCAHLGDLSPKYDLDMRGMGFGSREGSYKARAYVEGEVRKLARQLAALN